MELLEYFTQLDASFTRHAELISVVFEVNCICKYREVICLEDYLLVLDANLKVVVFSSDRLDIDILSLNTLSVGSCIVFFFNFIREWEMDYVNVCCFLCSDRFSQLIIEELERYRNLSGFRLQFYSILDERNVIEECIFLIMF